MPTKFVGLAPLPVLPEDCEVDNAPEIEDGDDGSAKDEVKFFLKDAVNSPSHYTTGEIEVLEAIEDWDLGFHLGNTVKYVARAGKKDPAKEIEDLEKADFYLRRKIELLRAKRDSRKPCRPKDMAKV